MYQVQPQQGPQSDSLLFSSLVNSQNIRLHDILVHSCLFCCCAWFFMSLIPCVSTETNFSTFCHFSFFRGGGGGGQKTTLRELSFLSGIDILMSPIINEKTKYLILNKGIISNASGNCFFHYKYFSFVCSAMTRGKSTAGGIISFLKINDHKKEKIAVSC